MGESIGGALVTIFMMIVLLFLVFSCVASTGIGCKKSIAQEICKNKGFIGLGDYDGWRDGFSCVNASNQEQGVFKLTEGQTNDCS